MKEKDKSKIYALIGLIIGLVGMWAILTPVSQGVKTSNSEGNIIINSTVTNEYGGYSVIFDLNPNNICLGDETLGVINTNIPNGVCRIFGNIGSGWIGWKNVALDADGDYSAKQTISTTGYGVFMVVCCDLQGNCKRSNEEPLTIQNCNNPTTTTTTNPFSVTPCIAIVFPTSQGSCSIGHCTTGTCTFIPATMSTPADCVCQQP